MFQRDYTLFAMHLIPKHQYGRFSWKSSSKKTTVSFFLSFIFKYFHQSYLNFHHRIEFMWYGLCDMVLRKYIDQSCYFSSSYRIYSILLYWLQIISYMISCDQYTLLYEIYMGSASMVVYMSLSCIDQFHGSIKYTWCKKLALVGYVPVLVILMILGSMVEWWITVQCGGVITWMIFSKILTIDNP